MKRFSLPTLPEKELPQQTLWQALQFAWHLGYIIAIPAVIFGLGGAYADKQLETSPAFILIGFVVAMLLSGLGVYRRLKEILTK